MITVAELTTVLGLPATAAERVARFAGAYTSPADYATTGRVAPRWAGQGMAATFTLTEAEELEAEWRRTATYAETVAHLNGDPRAQSIAERYRP